MKRTAPRTERISPVTVAAIPNPRDRDRSVDARGDRPPERRTLRIEISTRTLLTIVAVGAGTWLALQLWPIVLTVIVALILVGSLNPIVGWLGTRGIKRTPAVAMVFAGLVGAAALLALATIPALVQQVTRMIEHAPATQLRVAARLSQSRLTAPLARSVLEARPDTLFAQVSAHAIELSTQVFAGATYVVTTLFLALYLIADRDRVRGITYALVPRAYHLRLARILLNLETIVGGYVRGQVITSLFMAAFTFGLLELCGVRNPLPIAVLAGAADVLPFIGVFISVIPAVGVAMGRGPTAALIVLVAMLVYEEFESRVLIPRIYGKVLRLPPAAVIVALLAGSRLMGILGAVLALPVAAALRMIIEELRVELPGDAVADTELRMRDERAEREFAARTEGESAEVAAKVATQIAGEIRKEDAPTPAEAAQKPITSGLDGAKK